MEPKMVHSDVDPETNVITGRIVDAMLEVHRELGPGLLESLYKEALTHELQLRGSFVRREVPIPIVYKGAVLNGGLRLDLLVDDRVVVEAKAASGLVDVDFAQIDSYLHLTRMPVGFLVNFNVPLLKGNYHRRLNRWK